jgi:hypothetical protein
MGPIVRHRLAGSPIPPDAEVKHFWLDLFRRTHDLKIFIETGTYYGGTVKAMLSKFNLIYSIELDMGLWRNASERFASESHVHVMHGDSSLILPEVLTKVNEPCLFWLDGHFSGPGTGRGDIDSPIVKELSAINAHGCNNHVILIDDARAFNGQNGYPMVTQIIEFCKRINPNYCIRVKDDMIQIFLKKRGYSFNSPDSIQSRNGSTGVQSGIF